MTDTGDSTEGTLGALDRLTSWVERPVRRLAGPAALNPLPHSGTISTFLLAVVVGSGLYITLFFQFGYEASYESVRGIEDHAIQRVVRALHRYSSAALVVTTLVHAWRILTAQRFRGRGRRWRWLTGAASLLTVWGAGVTGYWLVRDQRAQALDEVVLGLFGGWPAIGAPIVRNLALPASDSRTGATVLLVIWLVHLLLTVVIGWFAFRHLRRTKLAWWPPAHWVGLMGLALLLVSLALPVGLDGPADATELTRSLRLDPFVLFLLPPLLSDLRWVAVAVGLAVAAVGLALPWLLRRPSDDRVVEIDAEECTGCELCVLDCPYEALRMEDRPAGASERHRDRLLAVLDPQACVGCGICLGSCAFGAIELPGVGVSGVHVPDELDLTGTDVVVACDRHRVADVADHTVVLTTRCSGATAPSTAAALHRRGAASIQLVGCAPGECRYGLGNSLAAHRADGSRAPHPPRRLAGAIRQDWVAVGDVERALDHPGTAPVADTDGPVRRDRLVGAAVVVAVSVVAAAVATQAPFRAVRTDAEVRVVVEHTAGSPLVDPVTGAALGPLGELSSLELRDGDRTLGVRTMSGEVAAVDWPVEPGASALTLIVSSSAGEAELALGPPPEPGRRTLVVLEDEALPPGAADGRALFTGRRGGCTTCHSVEAGEDGVGPSLYGVADVAAERVPGLDAAGYLRQSLLLPDQYVVEGYPAGQMLPIYRDRLTDAELEALITYLLTLEGS